MQKVGECGFGNEICDCTKAACGSVEVWKQGTPAPTPIKALDLRILTLYLEFRLESQNSKTLILFCISNH